MKKREYTREEIEQAEKNLSGSEMKRAWWTDVKNFDPSPIDIEKRIWALFVDAFNCGIDHITALLIVREHAKANKLPVKETKIVHKAWGVFMKGKADAEARYQEKRDVVKKPPVMAPAMKNIGRHLMKPKALDSEKAE